MPGVWPLASLLFDGAFPLHPQVAVVQADPLNKVEIRGPCVHILFFFALSLSLSFLPSSLKGFPACLAGLRGACLKVGKGLDTLEHTLEHTLVLSLLLLGSLLRTLSLKDSIP